MKDIADPDTIHQINELSSDVYGKIIDTLKNGTNVSEIKPIIECIIKYPDEYSCAYSRLQNIEKAYESVKNFNEIKESYKKVISSVNDNGKSLKDNLEACGIKDTGYCHCAHHIVAKGDPEAKEAVEILNKYKIDIDSACNGVLLPGGSKTKDYSWVINEANHFGGHSNNYYKYVNDTLDAVDRRISGRTDWDDYKKQKEICNVLNDIRIQLLNGKLKIQNKETLD